MMSEVALADGLVAVLGLPFDENSSFMSGAALAPARIRAALHSGASNLCTEDGRDLAGDPGWRDAGDVDPSAGLLTAVETAVAAHLARGERLLCLGGDHAVTYPILRAYGRHFPNLTLLQIDAHPDLYDVFDGNRLSHACPFARIMEAGLATRLVQVGIRTMTPHQQAQATRFGVEVVDMVAWAADGLPALAGPIYLSLDLDALDPAYAPGVSHHEPGGLRTREVIDIIHRLPRPIVGADIVEYNPTRDPVGLTGMVAAKLLKEIVGRMLAGAGR